MSSPGYIEEQADGTFLLFDGRLFVRAATTSWQAAHHAGRLLGVPVCEVVMQPLGMIEPGVYAGSAHWNLKGLCDRAGEAFGVEDLGPRMSNKFDRMFWGEGGTK